MTFYRLLAQNKCGGDLAVALGERHQTEDFNLAPGQPSKGAPREPTGSVRGRRRIIAGEGIRDGLAQRQSRPLPRADSCGSLTEPPRANPQPAVEPFSVRWKRRGP